MPVQPVERKLAAIFAADIAGYSRLMARDEVGTLARLKACRAIIDGLIASHRGRIFNTAGDSVVADFASAVDAVQCAVAVQAAIAAENAGGAADEPMQFRIGVHVGDVMVDGENLLGDGVNIAARLEALAEPGAICISGAARDHIGNKLPLGFDDLGDQQVKNIAQAIRVYRVQAETSAPQPVAALPLPDKPSIAVLPFQNMSGDPEQEYFADGMVEEIITALSRIRWLFVIARNSTLPYKGQRRRCEAGRARTRRALCARRHVRKGGDRVRITAQLIDAETGTHLWADRFDGSIEDVFELQDHVATSVAGVIEPALQAAEAHRSANRPTDDLTAYDLYLRALPKFASLSRDSLREALDLLNRAIARDPLYGPALALAAMCTQQLHLGGWVDVPEDARNQGVDYARRAIRAAESDPFVLASAAYAFGYFGEEMGAALALIDRALVANPGSAYGWFWSGTLRMLAGQPDTAIEHMETSLRLNPRDRLAAPLTLIGAAQFYKREFELAAANLQASLQERPGFPMTYRFLAACYAHMGQLDEARKIVQRLRTLSPVVVPPAVPFRKEEDRELFLSGLRLAAGETG